MYSVTKFITHYYILTSTSLSPVLLSLIKHLPIVLSISKAFLGFIILIDYYTTINMNDSSFYVDV